ncbi:hypothetical protein ACR77J_17245 [Tissierella praeacuta]|uniref:hypothetical protein n=1 Tax=Tissierella praeacuta TaxID=43131 RepID=UPI003DA2A410
MKKRVLILICILLSLTLISCTKYRLIDEVDAKVINKEYKESYTIIELVPIFNGKTTTMMPRSKHHSEKHCVELKYKNMTITINDKELYNSVDIDDNVKVNYYKSEDKEKIVYEK